MWYPTHATSLIPRRIRQRTVTETSFQRAKNLLMTKEYKHITEACGHTSSLLHSEYDEAELVIRNRSVPGPCMIASNKKSPHRPSSSLRGQIYEGFLFYLTPLWVNTHYLQILYDSDTRTKLL